MQIFVVEFYNSGNRFDKLGQTFALASVNDSSLFQVTS